MFGVCVMPEYYLLIPKDEVDRDHTTLPEAFFLPQTLGNHMFGKDLWNATMQKEKPDFDPTKYYCVKVEAKENEGLMMSRKSGGSSQLWSLYPTIHLSGVGIAEATELQVTAQIMPDKSEKAKEQVKQEYKDNFKKASPNRRAQMLHAEDVSLQRTVSNLNDQKEHFERRHNKPKTRSIDTDIKNGQEIAKEITNNINKENERNKHVFIRAKRIIGTVQKKLGLLTHSDAKHGRKMSQ